MELSARGEQLIGRIWITTGVPSVEPSGFSVALGGIVCTMPPTDVNNFIRKLLWGEFLARTRPTPYGIAWTGRSVRLTVQGMDVGNCRGKPFSLNSPSSVLRVIVRSNADPITRFMMGCRSQPQEWVPVGLPAMEVALHTHEHDKHGRSLAVVLLPDGTNVNNTLVKDGWCWWYRSILPIPPLP